MNTSWKKVSAAEAAAHRLYGVKNWLAVFAFGVLLGLLQEVGSLNAEAYKAGLSLQQLLSVDHPAITFSKIVLALDSAVVAVIYWLLFTKHAKFRIVASSLLLGTWPAVVAIGMLNPFPGLSEAIAMSFFPWALSCAVWVIYLNRSRRVRVTFEHMVRVDIQDPLRVAQSVEPQVSPAKQREAGPMVSTSSSAPFATAPAQPAVVSLAGSTSGIDDENLWATAISEFDGDNRRAGLWAKAYAECNGNESEAKAAYLRERVRQLATEMSAREAAEATRRDSERRVRATSVEGLKAAYASGTKLEPKEVTFLVAASETDPSLVHLSELVNGETLLHWCARFSLQNEAELLIKRGADARAPNGNGQKPFALAKDPDLRWRLLIAAGERET